jgi:hypothetical protein
MALGYSNDYTQQFNTVYNIQLDMSGWDKATIQVVSPVGGSIAVLATNDNGAVFGVSGGSPETATNFSSVQVKNLQTGASVNFIYGAGLYEYDVNAQFLKLNGTPAQAGTNVGKLVIFNSKIS